MTSSNNNIDDTKYKTLVTDEDHRKKIEYTHFAYVVALSGVGKTFTGDYLEAIQGWKHVDGDIIFKTQHLNEYYNKLVNPESIEGMTDFSEKMVEFNKKSFYQPFYFELARLMLEGAKESNKVVLSQATFKMEQRLFVREKLIKAGAKSENITMIFLDIDNDVHDKGAWKRWNYQAECSGCSIEDLYKNWMGIEGIVDFDTWVAKWQDGFNRKQWIPPQELERPYEVVDVSARDITVLDSIDKALNIESTRPNDLMYEEMQEKIAAVDKKRDKELLAGVMESVMATKEEKELAKTDPEKYIARRSSLLEADKFDAIRKMSEMSSDYADGAEGSRRSSAASVASNKSRRQSFLETGTFEVGGE